MTSTYSERLRAVADLLDSSPLLEQIEDQVRVQHQATLFHLNHGVDNWREVVADIVDRFGPLERTQSHGDFLVLERQTDAVGEISIFVPRFSATGDIPEVDLEGLLAPAADDEAVSA
jgi:hypothetical protein